MMTSARTVHAIPAAIFLLVQAFASPGFAQDGMQLDTMFRESLSQGRDQAKGGTKGAVFRDFGMKDAMSASDRTRKGATSNGAAKKGDSTSFPIIAFGHLSRRSA